MTSRTKRDMTKQMVQWSLQKAKELEKKDLHGFIFKANSPSSGMERVKIYDPNGVPNKKGVGIFAGIFMKTFPLLPVEDEGRLHDPALRENFIEQIFVFRRWRDTVSRSKSASRLVDFHTKHKLLILAHSPRHYSALGNVVAQAGTLPSDELYSHYQTLLMEALKLKPTIKKNTNVLLHMVGYFKKQLSPDEKQELLEIIEQYRNGYVPLIVPITLLGHYVRKYGEVYLAKQYYLHPHPIELQLRNHV